MSRLIAIGLTVLLIVPLTQAQEKAPNTEEESVSKKDAKTAAEKPATEKTEPAKSEAFESFDKPEDEKPASSEAAPEKLGEKPAEKEPEKKPAAEKLPADDPLNKILAALDEPVSKCASLALIRPEGTGTS
ncbi:MAG: hypothetical protein JRJ87_14910, partial [Deltaproteobacteria bacterium]|nr:hypothetical protein [Deltaproteobacteria bacterium]